jgi:hypothetical protein
MYQEVMTFGTNKKWPYSTSMICLGKKSITNLKVVLDTHVNFNKPGE